MSTNVCPIHTSEPSEPVDITGETENEDDPSEVIDGDGESGEPPDSHDGLDQREQTLIDPNDISD